jgi:hypothetical protein
MHTVQYYHCKILSNVQDPPAAIRVAGRGSSSNSNSRDSFKAGATGRNSSSSSNKPKTHKGAAAKRSGGGGKGGAVRKLGLNKMTQRIQTAEFL